MKDDCVEAASRTGSPEGTPAEVKAPDPWYCDFCGYRTPGWDLECRNCERARYYRLTQSQARAVARKLNKLEKERDDARRWYRNIVNADEARYHLPQPCGHERRLIVNAAEGANRCVLCELSILRRRIRWLANIEKEANDD